MAPKTGSNGATNKTAAAAGTATAAAKADAASSTKAADSSGTATMTSASTLTLVMNSLLLMGLLQAFYRMLMEAYQIRLYAIKEYGRVIHEFDPYFNYRATEYLWANGWEKFAKWFDYKVWYPLGRPVGTTIFPGMQVTACLIKQYLLPNWSINDICCFIPAWFGVTATLSVAWLTWECVSGNQEDFTSIFNDIPIVRNIHRTVFAPVAKACVNVLVKVTGSDWGLLPNAAPKTPLTTSFACAVCSAAIMAIVPAHLLRSVGGGYDNESVAVTAMCLTFACWTTSLKPSRDGNILWNGVWGVITGIAYFNMVAAWGGYVFVLNLVAAHAGSLVLLGRYSRKLWIAYSCFYIVGTTLAIRVPVVGRTPLKSLEQIGALVGFFGLQLLELSDFLIRREERRLQASSSSQKQGNNNKSGSSSTKKLSTLQAWRIRLTVFLTAGAVAGLVIAMLLPTGYFGPISSRVRGLFVKHTKTGNPLVDSVAEHQAASPQAYFQYLQNICYLAPIGFVTTALFYVSDSSSFLLVYGLAAYYFSHRMVRLVLLTGPIASSLGGIVLGRFITWMFSSLMGGDLPIDMWEVLVNGGMVEDVTTAATTTASATSKDVKNNKKASGKTNKEGAKVGGGKPAQDPAIVRGIRLLISAIAIFQFIPRAKDFWDFSHTMATHISHPSIILKGTLQDGTEVMVDDYREAYLWLKDNTPEDARIMAWWDYGYQITGISDRTTIADGNTWNHEHIAFLGRILTSPEKEAHRIARHLADYVLVWAGGGGDDLAKSPHLRRIANSVFRGLCKEPTCRDFGFYPDRSPTEDMEESLLYKLVANKQLPDVTVDSNRFKEVYRTKYGKVRIYKIMSVSQDSKKWVADPANRLCDAPGSWVCRGQYPPALKKILAEKKDFRQLEDFNRKKGEGEGEDDADYQREYMENLMKGGHHPMDKNSGEKRKRVDKPEKPMKLTKEDIEMLNEKWENNGITSLLWQHISEGDTETLKALFQQSPAVAHVRSEDGRGPMWWAHEYGHKEIVGLLKSLGVSETRADGDGKTPLDISTL